MKQLSSYYEQAETKLHGLSFRERIIITGALVVLIVGLFDQLFLSPNLKQRAKLEAEKAQLQTAMQQSIDQIDELELAIKNDPNRVLDEKIKLLQEKHHWLDQQIASITDGMISAETMPYVLGELLSEQTGLKVQSIKSKPAQKLIVADEHQENSPTVYRHDIEMRLQGSYGQMLSYLLAIEDLPTKLLWDDLEYRVDQYPKGSLSLRVHTLSTQEDLIRVAN